MKQRVLHFARRHHLLKAGDRVAVAVSGGADSVALLRVLLELREEIGLVLSVAHYHHGIRGAEADADQAFVRALAEEHGLADVFYCEGGDAPAHARSTKQSLETAARDLRHCFFAELRASGKAEKMATAHTMDDQAETVLMRLLRGAGTRGLAAIHPQQKEMGIIRPLLGMTRAEVEAYLRGMGQAWRQDSTNRDLQHTRNRVRHELLPLLRDHYNPGIVQTLARFADVTRDEEAFWCAETALLLPLTLLPGKPVRGGGRAASSPSAGLDLEALRRHPLALQRRLLRALGESLGITVDQEHVEAMMMVASGDETAANLPDGWVARRSARELRLEQSGISKSPRTVSKAGQNISRRRQRE